MSELRYKPIKGWFDLSKLALPKAKLKQYEALQMLGESYQRTYAYQKQHNSSQLEKVKELCTLMQQDLICNYGALEKGA